VIVDRERVREEEEDVLICNPPPYVLDLQFWMRQDSWKDKVEKEEAMIAVGEEEELPNVHDVM
jgi:hypothetical protein